MVRADRVSEIGAHAVIAGCVAICVFGVVAIVGWLVAGAPQDALERMALAVPAVFTVAVAVRGFGAMMFRNTPNAAIAIATDVGICVAGLVFIASVGSITDSNGYALYGVLVVAPFVVAAAVVVSVVIQIVLRWAWLVRGTVAFAAVLAVISLGIFAVSIS